MRCPNCGFENLEGMKFCNECAAPLKNCCPNCGFENPPRSKFCGECATPLTGQTPAPRSTQTDRQLDKQDKKGVQVEPLSTGREVPEAERRQLTVMFCDLVGSTALSEQLDPEELREVIRTYQEVCAEVINRFDGHIAQYLGDGLLVYFGYPIAHEDDAQRAVRAGLGIVGAIHELPILNVRLQQTLQVRVGVHTGLVVVGEMGGGEKRERLALGDTLNIASRLQNIAETNTVVISSVSYLLVEGLFKCYDLGPHILKGISTPIQVYHVLEESGIRSRFEVAVTKGLTPMVGREREVELIKDSLEKMKEGRGQVVCIVGEAGVGKSRLVYEFKSMIRGEKVTHLEGHCISYGKSFSFLPIIEILKNKFAIDDRDNDEVIKAKIENAINRGDVKLKDAIPLILDLLSVKTDYDILKNLDAEKKRQSIFETLKTIMLIGSRIRPLVIVIEDLHWIDKTSEDFLNYLAGSIGNQRIMLLFTCRPGFVHSFVDKPYYTQIALTSLSTRECRVLVESILQGENVPEDLMKLILERTGGNAFFVEEVIKSLLDRGIIVKSESGYSTNKNVSQIEVPNTIQDIIMARIDRLEENRKRTLQIGSVIGSEFSFELLQKLSTLNDEELRDHLLALRNSELIYERGFPPNVGYVFKHALTHEVAYGSLLVQKRKELHERVGIAIEELYPNRLEEFYGVLAHHYCSADDKEMGLHYLTLAGKKAKEVVATEEALNYFREALKRLDEMPEMETNEERKIDILFEMENLYDHIGKREEQKKILERIIDSSGVINDERRLSDGYIKQAEFFSVLEEYQKAQEVGESALTLKREIGDKVGEGKALRGMGFINWRSGDYENALKYHQEALSVHRELGGGEAEGFDLISLGEIHRKLGQYEDALSCLQEALRIYRELGISSGQHVSAFNIGNVYRDMGDYQACLEYYQESWRMIKERGYRILSGMIAAPSSIADIYWRLGNFRESLRYYSEALDIIRGLGDRREEGNILSYMAAIYSILGDYQESINHYEGALKIYREIGNKVSEGGVLTLIGNIYRQSLLDYREALSYYKESLKVKKEISDQDVREPFDGVYPEQSRRAQSNDEDEIRSLLNSLGVVCWNLGLYEEALSYYEEALEICRKTGNAIGEGITLSGMGVVYQSLFRYEEALKYSQEALKISKAAGDKKAEGYILNSIGNVYYELGDHQGAWKYYQESLRIRKELGDKKGEAWVLNNLGRVYQSLENYEEAKKCYKQALSLAEEVGQEELTANSKNALSEITKKSV
jgi:predicted ATPase/class 3 adenylate cyclase